MRSSFHSAFGAARSAVPFAAVDPSIISSAIQAGGAIATTAISAAGSGKKSKKKKKKVAEEPVAETAPAPVPSSSGVPSWALWAGVGALVLIGGFLVLRRSNARAGAR
jgi:hypothetical protein